MSESALLPPADVLGGPLGQLIDMGGPVMVVLAALAVIGLVTFMYLMLVGALYAPRMDRRLRRTLTAWRRAPEEVHPTEVREQAHPLARLNPLMHLVLDTMAAAQAQREPQAIRETAARDAQQALQPFEAPLKIIEVIAALAPLLGLLGTVMGMIDAFGAMAAAEGRANASQLSGGIYEALTTTAAGLVLAIPFAALAAWIEFRLRRLHALVNSTLVTVLNDAGQGAQQPAKMDAEPAEAKPRRANPPQEFPATGRQRLANVTG